MSARRGYPPERHNGRRGGPDGLRVACDLEVGWWRECRDGRWVDVDAAGKLDEMVVVGH